MGEKFLESVYYWPAYTQCEGEGRIVTVVGVCRRL